MKGDWRGGVGWRSFWSSWVKGGNLRALSWVAGGSPCACDTGSRRTTLRRWRSCPPLESAWMSVRLGLPVLPPSAEKEREGEAGWAGFRAPPGGVRGNCVPDSRRDSEFKLYYWQLKGAESTQIVQREKEGEQQRQKESETERKRQIEQERERQKKRDRQKDRKEKKKTLFFHHNFLCGFWMAAILDSELRAALYPQTFQAGIIFHLVSSS